eukprot:240119-Prymnesium_polylepis.1
MRSCCLLLNGLLLGARASESCVADFQQCGGGSYSGPTNCCTAGLYCRYISQWHSQCDVQQPPPTAPVASPSPPNQPLQPINFMVAGGHILANGAPFDLKGVNWFGMEDSHGSLGGIGHRPLDDIIDWLAANNFNAIRLPLSVANVLNGETLQPLYVHGGHNADLSSLKYLQLLDVLVERCAARGVLIMLDMHRLDIANEAAESKLWYSANTPEASLRAAWAVLANRYCAKWSVFAADLFNEPYTASWGQGSPAMDWDLAAQSIGDEVLATCPRWLIFVGGAGHNSIRCNAACSSYTETTTLAASTCLDVANAPDSLFSCLSAPNQTTAINHWWGGNMEGLRTVGVEFSNNLSSQVVRKRAAGSSSVRQRVR